ncbi:Zn finger protein HypA/HybF involved in hydrogenase expression [Christiangramia gaetbulicola]|uniref:Zn finger protein HypA/HybF involved in hydrogenase expression n=1 Tax=Christiangramia gaetbulicola TaxID=703340 RepID=A0A2T6AHZ7_9FLAO|nr:hypothetical protein [Christiangramia gaetbulicola]PTX43439.1 Zn finger protein HypA/HybF involved in hydrogenase expression [Christiangramia gaetbulicola]
MLYIQEGAESKLPENYRRINNICAIMYDQITEVFADQKYDDLKSTKFTYDRENHILVDELEDKKINVLDWFKENNLNEDISNFLIKHLTLSISSDIANFIYESLSCAQRGKMTVAYALLRKPFTDELLILEQLLIDSDNFINRFFHSGDPRNYDPSSRKIEKENIIENAVRNLNPKLHFTADFIYKLRYDKSSPNGLNGITNQALHIVTNDKNYKTLNQNLNFVFNKKEDIENYWDHYYYFVPYLLMYTTSIIDSIVFKFVDNEKSENIKNIKALKRFIGILQWMEIVNVRTKEANQKIYSAFQESLKIECQNCKEIVELDKPDFDLFFETEMFLCPKCFTNILNGENAVKPIKEFLNGL